MSKPYCKTLRHILPSERKLDHQDPLREPKNKDGNLNLTITNKDPQNNTSMDWVLHEK